MLDKHVAALMDEVRRAKREAGPGESAHKLGYALRSRDGADSVGGLGVDRSW